MTDTEKLAAEFPHIDALSRGCMSGKPTDWPQFQPECARIMGQFALAMEALTAVVAWFDAEDRRTGSFHDKMELCNYAEWMSRKALGQEVGEYQPVPRLLIELGGPHHGN